MSNEKITEVAFNLTAPGGKPHDKNPQIVYRRANPSSWLMIRPDRPFDQEAHRYADKGAKDRGDRAMKAWFEYLASKGFIRTFISWRGVLKYGQSIMVVCDNPSDFDAAYVPGKYPRLAPDFWEEFERSRLPLDRYHVEDPEMRERCRKMVADVVVELRARKPDARVTTPPLRPAREWKGTALEDYAALPPTTLSEEARRKYEQA